MLLCGKWGGEGGKERNEMRRWNGAVLAHLCVSKPFRRGVGVCKYRDAVVLAMTRCGGVKRTNWAQNHAGRGRRGPPPRGH